MRFFPFSMPARLLMLCGICLLALLVFLDVIPNFGFAYLLPQSNEVALLEKLCVDSETERKNAGYFVRISPPLKKHLASGGSVAHYPGLIETADYQCTPPQLRWRVHINGV